jgi:hypothetical protein
MSLNHLYVESGASVKTLLSAPGGAFFFAVLWQGQHLLSPACEDLESVSDGSAHGSIRARG